MTAPHDISRLAASISSSLAHAIQSDRRREAAAVNQAVRNGTVMGEAPVTGVGETVITVKFPNLFTEKPLFAPGFELAPNAWLTQGSFPIWSAVVAQWITVTLGGGTYYAGALIGLVIEGPTELSGNLHYLFGARSLSLPAETNITAGDVL